MRSQDSRPGLVTIMSGALCAALAGIAVGTISSDSPRTAVRPARAFDAALLCRPQAAAALQARAAKRSSGREP